MTVRNPRVLTQSVPSTQLGFYPSYAQKLISRVFGALECGELTIQTPGGKRFVVRGRRGPHAQLTIHSWRILARLAFGWDIGFAESYMAEEWSSPNLVALLKLASCNHVLADKLNFLRNPRLGIRLRHAFNRNTRRGSHRNIAAHYDLGNAFYKLWLDTGMTYSAGLFFRANQTLEQAQDAKIARVLSLLDLKCGEGVLEIGCGWGGLAERLLETHGSAVTAVTLSDEQLSYAQRRLQASIVEGRCDLRLQDYRDVTGTFDRIVSIEMLEAVGEAYWPTYFDKLRSLLRPGGIAVLQVITISEDQFESYRRRPDFIQRYIFPGGMLPTKQIIERETSRAGLQPLANEFFGEGYARTLANWSDRFQHAWPGIKALGFDERFKRRWEYYLAYCEVGFHIRVLDVGLYKLVRPVAFTEGAVQQER
jgi:cyclopropane-fatty-acyl-phospholipid synthase